MLAQQVELLPSFNSRSAYNMCIDDFNFYMKMDYEVFSISYQLQFHNAMNHYHKLFSNSEKISIRDACFQKVKLIGQMKMKQSCLPGCLVYDVTSGSCELLILRPEV